MSIYTLGATSRDTNDYLIYIGPVNDRFLNEKELERS